MHSLWRGYPVAKAVSQELARGNVLQRFLQEGVGCQRENRKHRACGSFRSHRRRLGGHCCV